MDGPTYELAGGMEFLVPNSTEQSGGTSTSQLPLLSPNLGAPSLAEDVECMQSVFSNMGWVWAKATKLCRKVGYGNNGDV